MTQMESPKRKMQKKNDYQRHKLFRKIKRRRKAQAEAEQHIAEKQLKKKLKMPKFDRGEDDGNYLYKSDIHINEDGSITNVRNGKRYDGGRIPEVVATARKIPTFKDIEKQIGRKITQDEIDKVEAQQMGLEYIPLHERSTFKDRLSLLDDANTYKWYADNKANESGYVENPLGNYANLMHINLANVDPYRFTISHEGGHMLGMGGPDLPSNSSQSILKQLKYLKYKSKQVLKPGYWYNDQFDLSEYPYEAVQNLRNLGQELNLSVGQQYPGYKNALDIINNSEKTTHSFLKPYLKTDEESMPYVWKALVGTQFGLSPIYINMLDDKKYNSGKDINIKKSKRGTFTKVAKQHGMSVQSFANKVLKNPSKYSSAMRKKANFAHNAASWKH